MVEGYAHRALRGQGVGLQGPRRFKGWVFRVPVRFDGSSDDLEGIYAYIHKSF